MGLIYFYLTCALLLEVEHWPLTTGLCPLLPYAAKSIILQLYLKSAIYISLSRSLSWLFLGHFFFCLL